MITSEHLSELIEKNTQNSQKQPEVLIKDIPDAFSFFPTHFDLNSSIHEPMKEGPEDYNLGTPLLYACTEGLPPSFVEDLLKHGADPNTAKSVDQTQNCTALMFATRSSPSKTVALLLEYGADVSLKTSEGHTVVDWMARYNNPCGGYPAIRNGCYFTMHLLEPDRVYNNSQTDSRAKLLILSKIYEQQFLKKSKLIVEETALPLRICHLISDFSFNCEEVSLDLGFRVGYMQTQFVDYVKREYELHQQNERVKQLGAGNGGQIYAGNSDQNRSDQNKIERLTNLLSKLNESDLDNLEKIVLGLQSKHGAEVEFEIVSEEPAEKPKATVGSKTIAVGSRR